MWADLQGLRTFPSMRDPSKLGDFEFEIRYGGIFPQGGPVFCVRQVRLLDDCQCPTGGVSRAHTRIPARWQFGCGEELRGITPDEVWSQVVQKLREVLFSAPAPSSRCMSDADCPGSTIVSHLCAIPVQAGYQWKKGVNGHALFGLSSPVVAGQLERLPGIEDCAFYKPAAHGDSAGAGSHLNAGVATKGGTAQGAGVNKAQQEQARLIKLQETYLQKQEQLMQRLEFERKREEAKERQRLEKEKQKALIEMQREEQRIQLEKSREASKIHRAEAEAKRKILQRAQGRLVSPSSSSSSSSSTSQPLPPPCSLQV